MWTKDGELLHSSMLPRNNTTQYHGGRLIKGVKTSPYTVVSNSEAGVTHVNRWSDCIGCRIEIVCLIDILSTIIQHFMHNEI